MSEFFNAKGFSADSLVNCAGQSLDLAALPAFLRVLLSADGTVTKLLEAFFWEPVEVLSLGQGRVPAPSRPPGFASTFAGPVLRRQVQLVGASSQTRYASADSLIRLEALDADSAAQLEAGAMGIGELLREQGLETYREIVDLGTEPDGSAVWRRYLIKRAGSAFIEIRESFPVKPYQSP